MGLVHSAVYVLQHYGSLELNLTNFLITASFLIVGPFSPIWTAWLLERVLKKIEKSL